ncbi:sigma 54-interacting transcriptional regulator [Aneurinibacillus sp. Ricciae_BoGa-3]|uniref:sigma-54 interaction domain-containing protein n=1 Tax=Aneurinibacillus sp. Ricciae_BoGa-3 TaxID=3022697 RepID=UPI00234194C1|nr:sigma 54-interacting transcriptional regulator [Aneurinibacillus sp. Ricciae_BoGa-3]WCK56650.1 sigma 54-interacting transcriptional regulator [Aneurinibacillus sp. Ricciae_BoGa-3]
MNIINISCLIYQEFDAMVEAAYDGISISNGDGIVIKTNPSFSKITGIQPEQIIGRNVQYLLNLGYYDQSIVTLVLNEKKPVTRTQNFPHNGKVVLVSGSPVFDKDNKISMVINFIRDLTDLNNIQNQLIENNKLMIKYKNQLEETKAKLIPTSENFVVRGVEMLKVMNIINKVKDVDSSLLILGESGVGKSMFVKYLHSISTRKDRPFFVINCGAIPEQLLESELFGYEKGAFTGALSNGKPGIFELADKGIVFLDEITELTSALQVKLLTFLQDQQFMRVGGTKSIKVDVRIISATNKDISQLVSDGLFREDLYYRINVIPITIPPLRERKDEIASFIWHFSNIYNEKFQRKTFFSANAFDSLIEYDWPGNVRELQNIVERLIIMNDGKIDIDSLPENIRSHRISPINVNNLKEATAEFEKLFISQKLKSVTSIEDLSNALGVHRTTLVRKMLKYGIPYKEKEYQG